MSNSAKAQCFILIPLLSLTELILLKMSTLERGVLNLTPTHTSHLTPTHTSHHTPNHDVSNYCTLSRKTTKKAAQKKKAIDRKHSGSSDDLLTGTKVSEVPGLEDYTVKVCVHTVVTGRKRTLA